MAVTQKACLRGELKQDWRRNVVGEVSDDADARAKCGKISLKYVALMDIQVCRRETRSQAADEIAIDFDCIEMIHMFEQRRRESAGSRPDLDNTFVAPGGHGGDDFPDDATILQKILAKPLSWCKRGLQRVQRARCRKILRARLALVEAQFHVGTVALLAYPFLIRLVGLARADCLARQKALALFGHVFVSPLGHLD